MNPKLLDQTILLCQWIAETPHIRGSITGMAAQVLQEAIIESTSQPVQPSAACNDGYPALGIWDLRAKNERAKNKELRAVLDTVTAQPVHPRAWLTQHEHGDMLWHSEKEAAMYCDEDFPPIPLYSARPVQPVQPAHTDHPARHWDRTCPACISALDFEPVQTKEGPIA